jgi:hypothetical protein
MSALFVSGEAVLFLWYAAEWEREERDLFPQERKTKMIMITWDLTTCRFFSAGLQGFGLGIGFSRWTG